MGRTPKENAAAILLVAVVVALVNACDRRTATETHGNFRIETWRTEAMGHTGHSFKVFHNHGRTSHLVAEQVQYFLDPQNPDRVLVTGCPDGNEESCALRYFDGTSDTTHLVTRDAYLRHASPLSWSPNGRFLALPAQYRFVILDLDSGEVFDAAAVLELREPGREIDFFDVTWAPDGSLISVKVWNSLTPPPSDIESDLLAIDPEASSIRYVATLPPARRSGPWHEWQRSGSGYSLTVLADNTFRKRPDQLPAQVEY